MNTDSIAAMPAGLANTTGVIGVVLFGSFARGDATPTSDVDVLVIHERSVSVVALRELYAASIARGELAHRVTPIFFTSNALRQEFGRHPSFAAHLRDEGVVLYRTPALTEVEAILNSIQLTSDSLSRELITRMRPLRSLSKLNRFNGEFAPALANLFAVGRSVVTIKLLDAGVHEYSWRRIFEVYAELRPDMIEHIHRVEELRPFYEHLYNRSQLPDDALRVNPNYVEKAILSINAIADA